MDSGKPVILPSIIIKVYKKAANRINILGRVGILLTTKTNLIVCTRGPDGFGVYGQLRFHWFLNPENNLQLQIGFGFSRATWFYLQYLLIYPLLGKF